MSEFENCLFCKIVSGGIPAQIVYQSDSVIAFQDVHPQAPTHLLFVPKKHTDCLTNTMDTHSSEAVGEIFHGIADYTRKNNLSDFRVVINNGSGAGQTVFHLHVHVLAGRPFSWPPG